MKSGHTVLLSHQLLFNKNKDNIVSCQGGGLLVASGEVVIASSQMIA